jgi:hypothetical protein
MMQSIGNDQAQIGYLMAERLAGRVTSCVICTVHKETRRVGFLVGPQNRDGFLVWASKPSRLRFVGCTIKPMDGCRCGTRVEI